MKIAATLTALVLVGSALALAGCSSGNGDPKILPNSEIATMVETGMTDEGWTDITSVDCFQVDDPGPATVSGRCLVEFGDGGNADVRVQGDEDSSIWEIVNYSPGPGY